MCNVQFVAIESVIIGLICVVLTEIAHFIHSKNVTLHNFVKFFGIWVELASSADQFGAFFFVLLQYLILVHFLRYF